MRKPLRAIALLSFFITALATADTPPALTWSFTAPSALGGTGEDWLYGVAARKDGSYVVCGYTELPGKPNRSALVALVSGAKKLSHEQTFGGDKGEATLFDITETASAYIAVGKSNEQLTIARIPKSAPFAVSWTVFPPQTLGLPAGAKVEGHSVRRARGDGVVIAGFRTIDDHTAALVVRLDPSLKPVKSFGNGGAVTLGAAVGAEARSVRSDGSGYIVAGSASSSGEIDGDTDIWVARIDRFGALSWSRTFEKAQLSGFKAPPRKSLCTSQPAVTDNEAAAAAEPLPDGGYLVAIHVNVVAEWDPPGCSAVISPSYVDVDAGLLKLGPSGKPQWSRFVHRFSGIDFATPFLLHDGGVTMIGNDGTSGTKVRVAAVHTDLAGKPLWLDTFLIAGDRNDCTFGLAATPDGGVVVAGNNDLHCEDYFLMKLGPAKKE
jgi:hypothetical protein